MPITLMNEHTGVFGVHVGHVWHEIPRLRGWLDALLDLYRQGVIVPVVDHAFSFDARRGGPPPYQCPSQRGERAARSLRTSLPR